MTSPCVLNTHVVGLNKETGTVFLSSVALWSRLSAAVLVAHPGQRSGVSFGLSELAVRHVHIQYELFILLALFCEWMFLLISNRLSDE